jgi:hypothetical protein
LVQDEVSRRLLGEGDRHRHQHHAHHSNAFAQVSRHSFSVPRHRGSESHIFDRTWQPIMSVNYLCHAKMLCRTAQSDVIGIRYLYLASSAGAANLYHKSLPRTFPHWLNPVLNWARKIEKIDMGGDDLNAVFRCARRKAF